MNQSEQLSPGNQGGGGSIRRGSGSGGSTASRVSHGDLGAAGRGDLGPPGTLSCCPLSCSPPRTPDLSPGSAREALPTSRGRVLGGVTGGAPGPLLPPAGLPFVPGRLQGLQGAPPGDGAEFRAPPSTRAALPLRPLLCAEMLSPSSPAGQGQARRGLGTGKWPPVPTGLTLCGRAFRGSWGLMSPPEARGSSALFPVAPLVARSPTKAAAPSSLLRGHRDAGQRASRIQR